MQYLFAVFSGIMYAWEPRFIIEAAVGGGTETSTETAPPDRGNRPGTRSLREYQRHSNPITGANLLDRGLRELDKLVPQVIIQVINYNFRGYRRLNEPTADPIGLAYGFERADEILDDEWFINLMEEALDTNAILTKELAASTRVSLTSKNFLEVYCSMYIRTAVNLRNLVAVMNMSELNEGLASFLIDANLPGGGRIKKALNLIDQLGAVPVPEFWKRRAIELAGVYKSGIGEPVILTLIGNAPSLHVGEKVHTMNDSIADLKALAQFGSSTVASENWALTILKDATWCIRTLKGVQSETANATLAGGKVPVAWNADVDLVHDLWAITNLKGSKLPVPLMEPLDQKFMYMSLVNDRPWMWAEERALGQEYVVLTNFVEGDQDTCVREFADAPPEEWYAGFGTWAMTRVKSADHTEGKTKVQAEIILYGEIDPWVKNVAANAATIAIQEGATRPQPFYAWYSRKNKWTAGLKEIDDSFLKEAGVQTIKPTLDPLFNRNVNLIKAARSQHGHTPVGKYPVNRPYMMDIAEQNLDDLSDGFLRKMSAALTGATN